MILSRPLRDVGLKQTFDSKATMSMVPLKAHTVVIMLTDTIVVNVKSYSQYKDM